MAAHPSHSVAQKLLKAYKLLKTQPSRLDHSDPASQLQSFEWLEPQLLQTYQHVEISFTRALQRLQERVQLSKEKKKERLRQLWELHTSSLRQITGFAQEQSPSIQQQEPAVALDLTKQQVSLTAEQQQQLLGTSGVLRHLILTGIAKLSHTFMHSVNSVNVRGAEVMQAALDRPPGQALITVCNHVAAMDDPLVMAAITPQAAYSQPNQLRWTLCATDRCFKNSMLVPFFRAAKVLPVTRGAGLKQPGLAAAEARLAQGDWVHIFPEGSRSRTPDQMLPLRKGVGRLIAAAAAGAPQGSPPPLVVPFVHAGMEDVMPVGRPLPKTGQQVHVIVGQPIPMADLLDTARAQGWSDDLLYKTITRRVERHMQHLHAQVHRWHHAELSGKEWVHEGLPGPIDSSVLYNASGAGLQRHVRLPRFSSVWEQAKTSASTFTSRQSWNMPMSWAANMA